MTVEWLNRGHDEGRKVRDKVVLKVKISLDIWAENLIYSEEHGMKIKSEQGKER